MVAKRLGGVAGWLGDLDWLEDRFTIGDMLMVDALRGVSDPALLFRLSQSRGLCQARHGAAGHSNARWRRSLPISPPLTCNGDRRMRTTNLGEMT